MDSVYWSRSKKGALFGMLKAEFILFFRDTNPIGNSPLNRMNWINYHCITKMSIVVWAVRRQMDMAAHSEDAVTLSSQDSDCTLHNFFLNDLNAFHLAICDRLYRMELPSYYVSREFRFSIPDNTVVGTLMNDIYDTVVSQKDLVFITNKGPSDEIADVKFLMFDDCPPIVQSKYYDLLRHIIFSIGPGDDDVNDDNDNSQHTFGMEVGSDDENEEEALYRRNRHF